jgi:methylated-DNA-[protein]-cysteine S-methyltransferase
MNPVALHALQPSPLGEILLSFDDDALTGLYFVGQKGQPPVPDDARRDDTHPLARRTARHLAAYFSGRDPAFDVPLRLHGTPFQRAVWEALRALPRGSTASYAAIARRLRSPAAVRAVGGAVGRNPVSIFVPCHRVVGSDGSLTGYAGGLARKIRLLELEGVRLAGRPPQRVDPGA